MASSARTLRRFAAGLAAAALSAAGCSGTPLIRIDAPVAKTSPTLDGACAVFMSIANRGDGADALLEATPDVPGAVAQIHAMTDGRMTRSDRVVVPAHGVVELRPGGLHIMLFNMPRESGPGSAFTLRLRFERSGEVRTSVKVTG